MSVQGRGGRLAVALAVAACLFAAAPAAWAACPKTSVADVEDEVMCPVCGTPLALAIEAPQARREREFILERVERCQSKSEIKAALAVEFGPDVLATPEAEGFDLAAYVVPALVLLGAAGLIVATGVRWRRRQASILPATAGETDLAAAEARRLDDELERYRG